MLKAIIFDAYGTLLCTGTGSVDAAGEILAKNGRQDISPSGFYARWKQLHQRHMDSGGPFLTEEAIYHLDLRALYKEYGIEGEPDRDVEIMLGILGCRRPYPEAKAVLEALEKQVPLCIGSITDTAPLQQDLRRGGLPIKKLFTSESLRCYKPAPRFYTEILRQLGLKPQEALFVGDSLTNDVAGPQAAGIPACWVNRKGEHPRAFAPRYTVSDLTGLLPIAESLLGGESL